MAPYPYAVAPSQRFRFEHFTGYFDEKEIEWSFQSFVGESDWEKLYSTNHVIRIWIVVKGFLMRSMSVAGWRNFDFVFLHREATPLGPPVFEWVIAKILKKRIIYDFDDAIWMDDGHDKAGIWTWLKWRHKVRTICSWSWKVSAGNQYLADFARKYCKNVFVIPTVVNTKIHKENSLKNRSNRLPVVGWTGSHSTNFYLDGITPILEGIFKGSEFRFRVISNRQPDFDLPFLEFVNWSAESEIEDLQHIDIGLMPLETSEWARGKCGFKLIQYGAIGIPSIASPVGVNSEIIEHGVNGFLAETPEEWKNYLLELINNVDLRNQMGKNARMKIVEKYSVAAIKDDFLGLFNPDTSPATS